MLLKIHFSLTDLCSDLFCSYLSFSVFAFVKFLSACSNVFILIVVIFCLVFRLVIFLYALLFSDLYCSYVQFYCSDLFCSYLHICIYTFGLDQSCQLILLRRIGTIKADSYYICNIFVVSL